MYLYFIYIHVTTSCRAARQLDKVIIKIYWYIEK